MANVIFAKGLQAAYDVLGTKDENTIYFITDTPAIYIGGTKYTQATELAKAIERITANETDIASIKNALDGIDLTSKGAVKALIDAVDAKIGTLDTLKTTAKTDLVSAINEAVDAINDVKTNSGLISVSTDTTTEGMLKSYTIEQGGKEVATIDIPKDLVVTAGETVEATAEAPITIGETQYTTGEFLKLTIANQDAPVYINATKLVDVYTAAQNATKIQLAVSNTGVISADVVAGSISTADLADNAITTVKIADGDVTKAKLATAVQASLDKADSAVQKVASGTANGTIAVDGTDVAVTGLDSAAYAKTTDFDAAGAATSVQSTLLGTTADASSAETIRGAQKGVAEAKEAAAAAQKAADDAASAGTTNLTEAKSYADTKAADAQSAATDAAKTYTDTALQWNNISIG